MTDQAALLLSEAPVELWAKRALDDMLARVWSELAPREPLTMIEWAERYRVLSREETNDYAGRFDLDNTPVLRGILAVLSDRKTRRVIVQKAAQQGYTAGVVCTVLGYHVHWKPCVQVVMFPREKSAKDFDAEKFSPMVRATQVLAKRIRLKSRSDGNSATRKHYPGGLAKFVASNSPSDVKSTSAKVRIVEEPDDTNRDVKGQGNSIALLRERGKTIRESLELIGGTPTAKGASEIEKEMRTTDQRRFMVPCHHCGDRHEVEWAHVVIPGLNLSAEDLAAADLEQRFPEREVYGRARFEDAFYTCPHCGGIWTDDDRIANIRAAARVPPNYGWEPTADAADPGFYMNELQSVFDGSRVPVLAEKYLRALHEFDRGEPEKMVAFWNSTRGLPWEYKGELPEEEELRQRAESYPEWTCPHPRGLVVVMSVDVQHDRLAVTVWVIGNGEEMWLAFWGELYGQTVVAGQGAWIELEQLLTRTVRHATGAPLAIAAVGIDCSDGQTSDASYAFVRRHNRPARPVLALKGASETEGRIEIWTPPKPVDPNNRSTKASRYGVQVNIVGAARAKDIILGWAQEGGRVRLTGNGPGRMHWYQTVRADFYEQLLGELKVPSRLNPKKRNWKARTDRRNEALDCTVYALYLSRHLRLHLRRPAQWDIIEMTLRQGVLIPMDNTPAEPAMHTSATSDVPVDPDPVAPDLLEDNAAPPADPDPVAPPDDDIAARVFADLVRKRNARRAR